MQAVFAYSSSSEGRFFARTRRPEGASIRMFGKTELREPARGQIGAPRSAYLPGAVGGATAPDRLAELQREEREGPATRTGLRYPKWRMKKSLAAIYSRRLART